MPKFTTPSFLAFILLLGALAMFAVISVSSPIWTPIYFLEVNNGGAVSRFGLWGGCGSTGGCSGKNLGYAPNDILRLSGNNIEPAISGTVRNFTYALVINIIAAGFTLFAFAACLISICGIGHFFTLILTLIALVFAATALAFDLGLWITFRNQVNRINSGTASLGKATWFAVAGAGALLIASFLLCVSTAAKRKARRDRDMDFPADYHEDRQELRDNNELSHMREPSSSTVGVNRAPTLPRSHAGENEYGTEHNEPRSEVVGQPFEKQANGYNDTNQANGYANNNPHNYYNSTTNYTGPAPAAAGYSTQPANTGYTNQAARTGYEAQPSTTYNTSYPAEKRQDSYYGNDNQQAGYQSNRRSLLQQDQASQRGSYHDRSATPNLPDPIPVKF